MRPGRIEDRQTERPNATSGTVVPRWVYVRSTDRSNPANVTGRGYPLKRLFDLLIVLAGLTISASRWLIFSVVIKLEDRRPILFTRDCWGMDQSRIRVYKFRTMAPNAIEKFWNIQAQENDPRVTRIGRFLGATSLDEIPQLLNILKGDMS